MIMSMIIAIVNTIEISIIDILMIINISIIIAFRYHILDPRP